MKVYFLLLLVFLPLLSIAQLTDNFSDGNLDADPEWLGNSELFTVTDQELQLFDTAPESSNTSYLYVPAPTSQDQDTNWEFFVRLEFAPSTSNFARVYLSCDQTDLTGPLNGYYVKIGGISGSDDAIELYRQDGASEELLISGTMGGVGGDPASASVRVSRTSAGEWTLEADYAGGTDYQTEGMATDNTYPAGSYFGFYCRYSSTRAESFFFDNISIDPLFVDQTPPELLSATAISSTEIQVQFDEPLEESSAEMTANYTIDNGIGQPIQVILSSSDPTMVALTLGQALTNLTEYQLNTNNISDTNGNISGSQSASFTFLEVEPAEPGDILITEIMADPNPPVALPEAEFVEIHNRSDKVLQLENFTFSTGSPQALPAYILEPEAYLVLCDTDNEAAFDNIAPGNVLALNSFPSLTNAGDDLVLTDPEGTVIHAVSYTDDWYQDPEKNDGGWTLELIQLGASSDCQNNWRASIAAEGGTPGAVNSLFGTAADQESPTFLQVSPLNETELLLIFDEQLSETTASSIDHYQIDNGISIQSANLLDPDVGEVLLVLSTPLQASQLYTLTILGTLTDCIGNPLEDPQSLTFGLAEEAIPGDIILAEIMAAPNEQTELPNEEYVELFNRSNKIVNLQDYGFSSGSSPQLIPLIQLLPGEYLILCDDSNEDVFEEFGKTVVVSSFPGITNSGDELILTNAFGEVMDRVSYTDDWYQDSNKDDGGWSLELIDPEQDNECRNNWRASNDPSGGTPGRENSWLGLVPDEMAPQLIDAAPVNPQVVSVRFDEPLNRNTAAMPGLFQIDNGLEIVDVYFENNDYEEVFLELNSELVIGTLYQLTVTIGLTDCLGNQNSDPASVSLIRPRDLTPGDVIINEILFNPGTGGNDFVELYNLSDQIFNLNGLEIINSDKSDTTSFDLDYLLYPEEYIAITEDPEDILSRYTVLTPAALIDNNLPGLDDRSGNVSIAWNGTIIDAFDYSSDLHYALLDDENGVSLERIDPNAPTQNEGNWHSAASAAGSATPTYQNSQFFIPNTMTSEIISIPRTTFSPDEDGFEDVLQINYHTPGPGYTLNIDIFDANGRLVRELVNNELLPSDGSYKWDGLTNEGSRARIGIYILFIELFTAQGQVEQSKQTCVVAGKLD